MQNFFLKKNQFLKILKNNNISQNFMRQAQKAFVRDIITSKLIKKFEPAHLEVVNESYKHKVAPGSETHFKVQIVSKNFENLNSVARHSKFFFICF